MSDTVGRILVPRSPPSVIFTPKPDYGIGVSIEPEAKTFQFQSVNAKIEQQFVIRNSYQKFAVCRTAIEAEIGQRRTPNFKLARLEGGWRPSS